MISKKPWFAISVRRPCIEVENEDCVDLVKGLKKFLGINILIEMYIFAFFFFFETETKIFNLFILYVIIESNTQFTVTILHYTRYCMNNIYLQHTFNDT